ncbi:MAG: hypothetical protein U1E21_21320 [Reyranellaceae bacterium]
MIDLDAGALVQELERHVLHRADTGRRTIEPARLALGERNQLGHRLGLELDVAVQRVGRLHRQEHRQQLAQRVVGQLAGEQRRVHRMRGGVVKQRVAVVGRARHDLRRNGAGGARLVVDGESLAQLVRQRRA